MKFINFKVADQVRLGIKTETGIIDVEQTAANQSLEVPVTIEEVIAQGEKALNSLAQLTEQNAAIIPEDEVEYAPSITNPGKIICAGLNYAEHVDESNMSIPSMPVLFSKFNTALAGHNQTITLPKVAEQFDYEAELVLVIGKGGKDIAKEDALSHVFGYAAGNDLSARDLQFMDGGQWLLGKSLDDFAPIGPFLATADEIDISNLDIQCKVNGEVRQSSNTKHMIFDCATIISYVSKHITLKPGDVIFTGTPDGVILGYPEDQRIWLKPGDKVEVAIENLGTLVNVLE